MATLLGVEIGQSGVLEDLPALRTLDALETQQTAAHSVKLRSGLYFLCNTTEKSKNADLTFASKSAAAAAFPPYTAANAAASSASSSSIGSPPPPALGLDDAASETPDSSGTGLPSFSRRWSIAG